MALMTPSFSVRRDALQHPRHTGNLGYCFRICKRVERFFSGKPVHLALRDQTHVSAFYPVSGNHSADGVFWEMPVIDTVFAELPGKECRPVIDYSWEADSADRGI